MKIDGLILWNVTVFFRNVQDLLSDGKTCYDPRFGEPFSGPTMSFGSMIENHPTSAKKHASLHRMEKKVLSGFGKKVLLGIFVGYALCAGSNWRGDILVAEVKELLENEAFRNTYQKT